MECKDCGLVTPTYVQENDATIIRDDSPTVETPFENTIEVIGVPTRTSKVGQKAASKRKRERYGPHHKDKEIDELMRIYGDRVTVLEDIDR